MTSDRALQREIERWVERAAPPTPWLEQRVIAAVRAHAEVGHRTGRHPWRNFGALGGFGSGLRLAAGLVALLLAIGTVAALLMSGRYLQNPTVPGGKSTTVQSPAPSPPMFTPSPAVRASNWPPGGPVPAQLAGSWQSSPYAQILHLGAYTFQVGEEGQQIAQLYFGNVVVNGSEIDFVSDFCTRNADFGFERFTYTQNGNTLVIKKAQGPGQSSCYSGLPPLAGTYSRVLTP
jgi:hypothetical protein